MEYNILKHVLETGSECMDLFNLIIPENKLHKNFKTIMHNKHLTETISSLADGFEDRDGKFVKEFQSTFNSSLWEIYCYAVFKEMGFNFDFTKDRPDFILNYNSLPFNVECVITNPAQDAIPEYDITEKLHPSKSLKEIVYDQVVRLLNSFSSKISKYKNNYGNLEFVSNNPFVIAVHAFEQPGFMKANTEAIRMALYGWNYDKHNDLDIFVSEVIKSNNSAVPAALFSKNGCPEISGVFFTTLATTGKFRALSDEPICVFEQLRFNEKSSLRTYQIDCRLPWKRDTQKFYQSLDKINKMTSIDFESIGAQPRDPKVKTSGYKEKLTDGLHLYLNPYARNPISPKLLDIFTKHNIQIHSYNLEKKQEEFISLNDGYLIQRRVIVFPNLKI